jgi:hypothetical protein
MNDIQILAFVVLNGKDDRLASNVASLFHVIPMPGYFCLMKDASRFVKGVMRI